MNAIVFDIETNGIHPSKIHCLSIWKGSNAVSTDNYDNMRSFFSKAVVVAGHNITRYDIPVLERLLNIKIKAKLIDTLALSWYLEPYRLRHDLDGWGEELGIKKPKIEDWENLSVEEYMHRCNQDVSINQRLWERQWKQLLNLYASEEDALRFIDYLMFKMDCARRQEEYGWKLDVDRVKETRERLSRERDTKLEELISAMPQVPVKAVRKPPAKPYKKNGQLSEAGIAWKALLAKEGLPEAHSDAVEYVKEYKQPNPGSSDQVKDWLFSLGWKPQTFNHVKNDDGTLRKIPQIQQDKTKGPGLCQSILDMLEDHPELSPLEGLSILTHRLSILNGFLDNVDNNGYVQAQIQGLTNTLRFKHKVIVNLPGVDKPYGSDIRGCLVAPEGFELAGSDMSSLEDNTARHYMYDHDPKYVEEMNRDDYDPHLDLAKFAGRITEHEYANARDDKRVKSIRRNYKTANYACKYGAGGAKLAITLGISKAEGCELVDAYWGRNWSVRKVAEDTDVKVCNGSMWLYNPVSKFWYSLRHEKDRFSTLNQGTGVYCFDTYLRYVRDSGPPILAQFHDEVVMLVRKGNREKLRQHLNKAIRLANEELGLNVVLSISLDFGDSYSDVH